MTNPTPIADWKCLDINATITHEELLTRLGQGLLRICNIVDGPTNALVLQEWNQGDNVWEKAYTYVNPKHVGMGKWTPEQLTFVLIRTFKWTDDFSWMRTMTCLNHPSAKYYTKNPFQRSVFLVQSPNGFPLGEECGCPDSRMAVVCNEWGMAVGKPADAEPVTDEDVPALPNGVDNFKLYANDNA